MARMGLNVHINSTNTTMAKRKNNIWSPGIKKACWCFCAHENMIPAPAGANVLEKDIKVVAIPFAVAL